MRRSRRPSARPGRVLSKLLATVVVLAVLVGGIGLLAVQSGWITVERGGGMQLAAAGDVAAQGDAGMVPAPTAPVPAVPPIDDSIALPPVAGAPNALAVPGAPGAAGDSTGSARTGEPLDSLSGLGVDPRSTAAPSAPPTASASETATLRGRMIVPVRGVQASALRDDYDQARGAGTRQHQALDIPAPRGTPVVAATDGKIVKLFDSDAGGLTVYQADASNRFVLLYGHLDRYDPSIKEGMAVRQGQVVGYVGTSGNASSGTPHLHFAVARSADAARWWGSGTPVNPYLLLKP